jgi:hypothetical protein
VSRAWLWLLPLAACGRDPQTQPARAAAPPADAPAAPGACAITSRPFERPAVKRLVAIGDVHGDLDATRAALRLAGAIDAEDRWIGGALTIVQTGDLLDRGEGEQAIIDLFERLEREADAAGGAFVWLLGNHELMNAAADFRYVTPGGWEDFSDAPGVDLSRRDNPELAEAIAGAPVEARPRLAALLPGGAYAKILAGQDVAVKVGDTVFSHAGFLPGWTADVAATNRAARCWLAGTGPQPTVESDSAGPVWTRAWGDDAPDCAVLREALTALDATRMVVAHTPQLGGITSGCDGALWRIDTGMASYYGGPIEVLEITDAGARPLRASSP